MTPAAPSVDASQVRRVGSTLVPASWAVGCAALVVGTWWAAVRTVRGQRLDALSYRGSSIGAWRVADQAWRLLGHVSTPTLAIVLVAIMLVALLRKQWWLSLEAAAVIGGANLTTQLLKNVVFDRPVLIDWAGGAAWNSLPSGHTTAAASAAVAGLLVVPRLLRPVIAVLGALVATVFGYSTIVGQWHRPADVVAAVFVVLAWALLALAVARARNRSDSVPADPPGTGVALGLLLFTGAVAAIVTVIALVTCWDVTTPDPGRNTLLLAYAGGASAVAASAALGLALVLRLLNRTP